MKYISSVLHIHEGILKPSETKHRRIHIVSRDTPQKKFNSEFFRKNSSYIAVLYRKKSWATLKNLRLFLNGPKYKLAQIVQKF